MVLQLTWGRKLKIKPRKCERWIDDRTLSTWYPRISPPPLSTGGSHSTSMEWSVVCTTRATGGPGGTAVSQINTHGICQLWDLLYFHWNQCWLWLLWCLFMITLFSKFNDNCLYWLFLNMQLLRRKEDHTEMVINIYINQTYIKMLSELLLHTDEFTYRLEPVLSWVQRGGWTFRGQPDSQLPPWRCKSAPLVDLQHPAQCLQQCSWRPAHKGTFRKFATRFLVK